MKIEEKLAAFLLIGFFAGAYALALPFPGSSSTMPKIVSLVGLVLSVILLIQSFMKSNEAKGKKLDASQIKILVITVLAIVAYVCSITWLGYFSSSLLFLLSLSYLIDSKRSKLEILLVAVGILAIVYGLFGMFLHVPFPQGMLF